MDATHREDAMHHESLAREQCHRIQANKRDRIQRDEALEREKLQQQEATELRQEDIRVRQEAALREEKIRADDLARKELKIAREKAQAEIKAKNKQFKIQANNELQRQKQDAEMKVQLAQMELMERHELEFQQEKMREKDITAKEMEAHLLLERQLAEEKRKTNDWNMRPKFTGTNLPSLGDWPRFLNKYHQSKGDPHILVYLNSIPTVYLRQVPHTLIGYLSHCQEYQKLLLSLFSLWRHRLWEHFRFRLNQC